MLAVTALDGDEILAMAGCSADTGEMWQIADVVEYCRGKGPATWLVTTFKIEIIKRGKIPFTAQAFPFFSWNTTEKRLLPCLGRNRHCRKAEYLKSNTQRWMVPQKCKTHLHFSRHRFSLYFKPSSQLFNKIQNFKFHHIFVVLTGDKLNLLARQLG